MTETRIGGAARPVRRPRAAPDLALRSTFTTNVALAVLAAATGILCARLLHPAGEGELAAIQAWPLFMGTLAMLGLDSALVYFIARQPERSRQLTSTAVLIGFLSSLVVGAVAWFILPFILRAQPPQVVSAARVFLLIGGIYAVVGIPQGSLRGAHSFTAWNLFRIAPGLAWLCILLTSWLIGKPNAIHLSRWYLVGTLACGLPVLIVVNRKLQGPLRSDLRLVPEMLRFGLPSAITSLPLTINLQFDQMLIIAFLPARSVGLYAIAVSWSGGVFRCCKPWGMSCSRTCRLNGIASARAPFGHGAAERRTARGGDLRAVHVARAVRPAIGLRLRLRSVCPFRSRADPGRCHSRMGKDSRGRTAGSRTSDDCHVCRSSGSGGYRRDTAGASPYLWHLWSCPGISDWILNDCGICCRHYQTLDPPESSLAGDTDVARHEIASCPERLSSPGASPFYGPEPVSGSARPARCRLTEDLRSTGVDRPAHPAPRASRSMAWGEGGVVGPGDAAERCDDRVVDNRGRRRRGWAG